MAVSSVSSTSSYASSAADSSSQQDGSSRIPQKTLGSQDFIKLLATQFQNQDPMKPMDDTAFIAQTAQFTALQNSTDLNTLVTQLRADQSKLAAGGYLGREVVMKNTDGTTTTGEVSAVDLSGSEPQLIINQQSYALSSLLYVAPVPTST